MCTTKYKSVKCQESVLLFKISTKIASVSHRWMDVLPYFKGNHAVCVYVKKYMTVSSVPNNSLKKKNGIMISSCWNTGPPWWSCVHSCVLEFRFWECINPFVQKDISYTNLINQKHNFTVLKTSAENFSVFFHNLYVVPWKKVSGMIIINAGIRPHR